MRNSKKRSPKAKREEQRSPVEEFEASGTNSYNKIKHRSSSKQININLYTKGLLTSVPITYNFPVWQQDIPRHGKRQVTHTQSKEAKQSSEPHPNMTQLLQLSNRTSNNYGYYIKGFNVKSR